MIRPAGRASAGVNGASESNGTSFACLQRAPTCAERVSAPLCFAPPQQPRLGCTAARGARSSLRSALSLKAHAQLPSLRPLTCLTARCTHAASTMVRHSLSLAAAAARGGRRSLWRARGASPPAGHTGSSSTHALGALELVWSARRCGGGVLTRSARASLPLSPTPPARRASTSLRAAATRRCTALLPRARMCTSSSS